MKTTFLLKHDGDLAGIGERSSMNHAHTGNQLAHIGGGAGPWWLQLQLCTKRRAVVSPNTSYQNLAMMFSASWRR
ncbi:MAG: hypothetical protein QOF63_1518 [Thermoanaerobaculia bacterium]|nr:hypothetical protein [Thermoanaerobaculia bacterium]MEA2416941.1 hypothetical protein [Thermoanaerobaculia bacterium]